MLYENIWKDQLVKKLWGQDALTKIIYTADPVADPLIPRRLRSVYRPSIAMVWQSSFSRECTSVSRCGRTSPSAYPVTDSTACFTKLIYAAS